MCADLNRLQESVPRRIHEFLGKFITISKRETVHQNVQRTEFPLHEGKERFNLVRMRNVAGRHQRIVKCGSQVLHAGGQAFNLVIQSNARPGAGQRLHDGPRRTLLVGYAHD